MNKTYTERYLVTDINNKEFKRKYGVKNVKKKAVAYKADNNASNRETWKQRILRKNPWLEDELPLFSADQAHIDSTRQEINETSYKSKAR